MITRLAGCLVLLGASTAAAQQPSPVPPPTRDAGWRPYVMSADSSGTADTSSMVRMPPGWHITTGPRTLYSDPTTGAGGRYRVESEMFHFPGPVTGYLGLLIGGRELESARPTGVAFLLRRDGMAALHAFDAGRESVLMDWTTAKAAVVLESDDPVKNLLRIRVEPDSLHFSVNGEPVFAVPNRRVSTSGLTAFIASAQMNAHITTLDITYPHAPPRGTP